MDCFASLAMTNGSAGNLRRHAPRVCKVPIEFSRPRIEPAGREQTVVDPDDRRDLGEIAGRENLVGGLEILVTQGLLDYGDAVAAQQIDHALARDAVEEGAVRRRCED